MKLPQIALLLLAIAAMAGLAYVANSARSTDNASEAGPSLLSNPGNSPAAEKGPAPDLQDYKDLKDISPAVYIKALEKIERGWRDDHVMMLLEVHRVLTRNPDRRGEIAATMQQATGESINHENMMDWMPWFWEKDFEDPEIYREFKIWLYSEIDEKFADYFDDEATGTIGMDDVVWGGVKQDGIPPLKDPEMISVDEAVYLDDDNVVFGVEINGDARAYPKRILAHHEMFKAVIGEVSVCGVY